MAKPAERRFPFAELLGMSITKGEPGNGVTTVTIDAERHFNPQGVAHGGVAYALADTAMGTALYGVMEEGQFCATIAITINYIAPIHQGTLECRANVVKVGKRVANIAADIFNDQRLVANATGNFAIFMPS
jgi:acyl-CoA thioesterase